MRLAALGALALLLALPAQAQDDGPDPRSTVVVPAMPGEAVRVTTYATRPAQRGRLAQRYRGLRADRSPRAQARLVQVTGVRERVVSTPRHHFVQRGGTFFQVAPQR